MTAVEVISGFDRDQEQTVTLRLEPIQGQTNSVIVAVSGYVDIYNSDHFLKKLRKVIEAGFINLILDASSINFLSSSGVGALVQLVRIVTPLEGSITLAGLQPKVREVLALLGFEAYFGVQPSVHQAILALVDGRHRAQFFPLTFSCPICGRRLKTSRHGRFRCSQCRTILGVSDRAQVSLG